MSFSRIPVPVSVPPLPPLQSWLVSKATVYGMKLPTRFQLIGQVTLSEYHKWICWYQDKLRQAATPTNVPYTCRTYARWGATVVCVVCATQ